MPNYNIRLLNIEKVIQEAGDELEISAVKELVDQGHRATGKLVNSVETRVITNSLGFSLILLAEQYGIFVDSGRRPRAKKVPVMALVEWVKTKAIARNDQEAFRVAYAIQQKIFLEGIPTRNAFKYSRNGRRVGWIDFVAQELSNELVGKLEQAALEDFEVMIDDTPITIAA